jgi:hypothetical protein
MEKIGYDRLVKKLYLHSIDKLQITLIPALCYAMADGQGDPNANPDFKNCADALFLVSHAIKALPQKDVIPDGYFEYHINVLEGIWNVPEGERFDIARKDRLLWTLMIMQPPFVTQALFSDVLEQLRNKKPDNPALKRMRFETLDEGLCCQATHTGPFDGEPATFALMRQFTEDSGYRRAQAGHHEVYVSDYRRNPPENLKTLLRFRVEKQ